MENINNNFDEDQMIQQILCMIKELYGCKYIKKLSLEKLPTMGYKLSIPLVNNEKPFVVCIEAEGNDYFKYLKKALQESSLSRATFLFMDLKYPDIKPNCKNI